MIVCTVVSGLVGNTQAAGGLGHRFMVESRFSVEIHAPGMPISGIGRCELQRGRNVRNGHANKCS